MHFSIDARIIPWWHYTDCRIARVNDIFNHSVFPLWYSYNWYPNSLSESVNLISLIELVYILGYFYFSQVQVTDEVREYLRKPTFDNWQWDDPEMIILLRQMYIELGLVSRFNIEVNHSLFLLRQLSDTCIYDSRYFLIFRNF